MTDERRIVTDEEARIMRRLAAADLANLLPTEDLRALLDTREALLEALEQAGDDLTNVSFAAAAERAWSAIERVRGTA